MHKSENSLLKRVFVCLIQMKRERKKIDQQFLIKMIRHTVIVKLAGKNSCLKFIFFFFLSEFKDLNKEFLSRYDI